MDRIVIAAGILCLLAFIEWMREIHTFKVTHYQIHSKKLSHLQRERKVIVLSDLHNYCYGKENRKLLEAVRREKPDMILIAGDMLIGKKGVPVKTAEELVGKLPEICDTYYGTGNHEQRMKEEPEKYGGVYDGYRERLLQKGVHFLENEKRTVQWDGQAVEIYGLEIPKHCYAKFEKTALSVEEIESRIGAAERGGYKILIAHNPVFAPAYLDWGADLVVSGHLHGGVVRIPGMGGLITPQAKLFPKYSGELTMEGEQAVVVSKGLGMHTLKVRLLNPAELIVLHIGREV